MLSQTSIRRRAHNKYRFAVDRFLIPTNQFLISIYPTSFDAARVNGCTTIFFPSPATLKMRPASCAACSFIPKAIVIFTREFFADQLEVLVDFVLISLILQILCQTKIPHPCIRNHVFSFMPERKKKKCFRISPVTQRPVRLLRPLSPWKRAKALAT